VNDALSPRVVLVPFVCPVCTAANGVHLISLSRAGGTTCAGCSKWLKSADVMRAIHAPRSGQEAPARAAVRAAPRQEAPVWPPTAASRAAIKPLASRVARR
jgi:hypothetical protein